MIDTITASLNAPNHRDAHRLYAAALTFVAHARLYDNAVLRAVSDKLASEASDSSNEPHEGDMMRHMAFFLALEVASRARDR